MVGDGFQPNVEEVLRANPDIIFQWGMSEDMVLYPDNFDWPLRSVLAEKYQEIYDHAPLTCGAAPADVARPGFRPRRRASASPDMPDLEETVTSLYRLTRWPVDCRHDLLASYPAFKLGERESIVHYARRLAPVVEALIAVHPQATAWALTAPPYHAIPAAANLLCGEIFRLLKGSFGRPVKLSLIEIAENVQQLENHRANADYSRLSSTERIEARERSASAIVHHQALSGQTVIFVNDINVTGAQQRVMRRYFEAIGVAVIHWIYIIDVADELGRQAPQIEYDLNTWKYGSFDDFAALLLTAEITFTSKCIARIFSYDVVELSRLFGMLSVRRRSRILELTIQEERYGGDAFGEKIDLLRAFCSREPQPE